jgi:hypothetical protein
MLKPRGSEFRAVLSIYEYIHACTHLHAHACKHTCTCAHTPHYIICLLLSLTYCTPWADQIDRCHMYWYKTHIHYSPHITCRPPTTQTHTKHRNNHREQLYAYFILNLLHASSWSNQVSTHVWKLREPKRLSNINHVVKHFCQQMASNVIY